MTGRSHLTPSCPAHPLSPQPQSPDLPPHHPLTCIPCSLISPAVHTLLQFLTYSARLSRLLSVVFAFQRLYSVICFLRPGNVLPASLNHCLTLAFLPAPLGLFSRLDFWLRSSPASLFQKPPQNKSLNCISLSSLFTSGCPPLLPLTVTPCLIHDL